MEISVTKDGMIVVGSSGGIYGSTNALTPSEAEDLVKKLRAAINTARSTTKHQRKKLGEY
jgi:hypothetical protein